MAWRPRACENPRGDRRHLDQWFAEALAAPETQARLASMRMAGVGRCGEPFGAFLRQQYDTLGGIVRDAGIKAE